MVASFFKWLALSVLVPFMPPGNLSKSVRPASNNHPYYISVVEIDHNPAAKTLEISVKIFTNDFETTLEKAYGTKYDLGHPKDKAAADKTVNDYVQKHLAIRADGRICVANFLGFDKEDEAIFSYYQVDNIPSVKKIDVTDALLHDFSDQQINIIHCTVSGKRQSLKLDYPKKDAQFEF
jgi:hypothetical protein